MVPGMDDFAILVWKVFTTISANNVAAGIDKQDPLLVLCLWVVVELMIDDRERTQRNRHWIWHVAGIPGQYRVNIVSTYRSVNKSSSYSVRCSVPNESMPSSQTLSMAPLANLRT